MNGYEHPIKEDLYQSNKDRKIPIFYLAHPIAPDEAQSYQQNMDNVWYWMRLCLEANLPVVAPYHTICMALDEENIDHRSLGLLIDVELVRRCDGIVLTGHRLSSGMKEELYAAQKQGMHVVNLIGKDKAEAVNEIHLFVSKLSDEFDVLPILK